jgi:hypothetical protein
VNRDNPKPKAGAADGAAASPKRDTVSLPERATLANNMTGRVKHDDRGNAIWEWAVTTGALAVETPSQRLQKLDNPTLSLAEDAAPLEVVKKNPLGTVKGYSPYDSGLLAKTQAPRKKDLKKLSEWMKLRKQAVNNRPDEEK